MRWRPAQGAPPDTRVWTFTTTRRVFGAPFFCGSKLSVLHVWSTFSERDSGHCAWTALGTRWPQLLRGTESQLTGVREFTDFRQPRPELRPLDCRLDSRPPPPRRSSCPSCVSAGGGVSSGACSLRPGFPCSGTCSPRWQGSTARGVSIRPRRREYSPPCRAPWAPGRRAVLAEARWGPSPALPQALPGSRGRRGVLGRLAGCEGLATATAANSEPRRAVRSSTPTRRPRAPASRSTNATAQQRQDRAVARGLSGARRSLERRLHRRGRLRDRLGRQPGPAQASRPGGLSPEPTFPSVTSESETDDARVRLGGPAAPGLGLLRLVRHRLRTEIRSTLRLRARGQHRARGDVHRRRPQHVLAGHERPVRLGRVLEAILGALLDELLERLADDVRHLHRQRRRRIIHLRVEDAGDRLSLEGPHAAEHLVEHEARGVQVRPPVDGLPGDLLRRHVRRSAHQHPSLVSWPERPRRSSPRRSPAPSRRSDCPRGSPG